jgi:hypothetical protein
MAEFIAGANGIIASALRSIEVFLMHECEADAASKVKRFEEEQAAAREAHEEQQARLRAVRCRAAV